MTSPTFIEKLWERKVPQLLGTYLAVGFGVLQFVEFISRRFSMSSFWVDSYLLLWLLLLPAVALLLYYKGLPAKVGKGFNWKKWAIFGNLGLALLLVFVLPGSVAPAATETVVTTDTDGKKVSRVIPSASSVQRIAVFELSNESEDETKNWWGTAYSLLLNDDLRQRPELLTLGVRSLNRYYSHFNVEQFTDINVGLQRKIAQRARTDYFVSGKYAAGEDSHEVNGGLYRTRDGKLVQTLQAVGPDIFTVVDRLRDQINDFLPPPVVVDQMTTELPASAMITDREEALQAYVAGVVAFSLDPGNLRVSLDYFLKALELDPNCAPCAYGAGDKLYGSGKLDSAKLLISKATRLAEVLPEREQFGYKSTLMAVNGSYDQYYRLMESYRSLYPYEFSPYEMLESYYARNYGLDSAIVLMQQAAELSDRERALGKLYQLYVSAEDYEKVEAIIKDLEQEFPDSDKTRRMYASLYQTTGQMDKAREILREMQALDPLNFDVTNHIIFAELRAGNYDEVEKLTRKAMAQATNIADSTTAWNYLIQSYSGRGQFDRAMKELLAFEDLISRTSPRNVIINNNFATKSDYAIKRGRFGLIDTLLAEVAAFDASRAELYGCYIPVQAAIYGIHQPGGAASLEGCRETLLGYGPSAEDLIDLAEIILTGDYGAAVALLDERQAAGKEMLTPSAEARLRQFAGDNEKALKVLKKALVARVNDPVLLLELALSQHAMGDTEAAKKSIAGPLKTWANADADFIKLQEAKALANELGLPPS
ncbi:tetratricopeptide repeat protein [Neolewinella persica]|uniref:tetratricopeptide repeat protein n=1 Tax=Neolewinella persica TaxID=70998 RepID=UPI0003737538|nr:tetratricopeptide repeat protein [Neolewinella persica]